MPVAALIAVGPGIEVKPVKGDPVRADRNRGKKRTNVAIEAILVHAEIRRGVAQGLLDPAGWNITFKLYAKFESRSRDWLTQAFVSKVTGVPKQRKEIIDAAKAIRNCIAHQSESSFTEMNTFVGNLPNSGVARHLRTTVNSVSNVGAYLKSTVDGKMRVEHYLDEFKKFGGDLA
jgi:hypothetical protein